MICLDVCLSSSSSSDGDVCRETGEGLWESVCAMITWWA